VCNMICPPNHSLASSKVDKLHPQSATPASLRRINRFLLGNVWMLGLALALAATPASAQQVWAPWAKQAGAKHKHAHREVERAGKAPVAEMPKGPMQAIISIKQQRLHFYRDGEHIADVPVATGVPGHLTPLGVFSVIQRDRYHHSNIYSNAPMPFMERITWSGVALHEGPGVGHQASHGCIRMPHGFAAELWGLPTMGMRVIIAGPELRPIDFADPHLFVHKSKPAPMVALPKPLETAQTHTGTKTDATEVALPAPAAHTDTTAAANATTAGPSSQTPNNDTNSTNAGAATEAKTAEPGPAEPANTATNNAAAPAPAAESNKTAQPAPAEPAKTKATTGGAPADITAPIALDDVPLPLVKPERIAKADDAPIAIFVSRKLGKIFVRQNFMPLLEAPVKIEHPEQPLGTHVFTALNYLSDHSTLRWNVVSLPGGEAPRGAEHFKYIRNFYGELRRVRIEERVAPAAVTADTPEQALARIDIPQDVTDQISQLIVPGSSLVISDQGLGPETGSGTDFIVVSR
jgi:L,D-transpeptidase catalytic domain